MRHSNITLPNHTRISVTLTGDVSVGPNLTLKDVLFVPKFKFNLLSVSALLLHTDFSVNFWVDHFIIQDLNQQLTIGKDKLVVCLYVLDVDTPHFSSALVNVVAASTWHNRLGHVSFMPQ